MRHLQAIPFLALNNRLQVMLRCTDIESYRQCNPSYAGYRESISMLVMPCAQQWHKVPSVRSARRCREEDISASRSEEHPH